MVLALKIQIEGLYFNTFRKPTSTSTILTYPIPPFTTLRGLLSNAMGLTRDDLSLQDKIKIGIRSLAIPEKNRELAKILKLKGSGRKYQKNFPSAPIFKEFLANPSYEIFIIGDNDIINKIYRVLSDPVRPLYLGASDELMDMSFTEPTKVFISQNNKIHSVIEGIHSHSTIEKLPYKFRKRGKNYRIDYLILSIPIGESITTPKPIKCYVFNDLHVIAY